MHCGIWTGLMSALGSEAAAVTQIMSASPQRQTKSTSLDLSASCQLETSGHRGYHPSKALLVCWRQSDHWWAHWTHRGAEAMKFGGWQRLHAERPPV